MLFSDDHEGMVQAFDSGEHIDIKGFKEALELIFDFAFDTIPVITESQYQASYDHLFKGETWMSPPLPRYC